MGPYPWDKLFINVLFFFFLNNENPLIIKDCSFQIALVWFNLPLALIIWVTPREENTDSGMYLCWMCCRKTDTSLLHSGSNISVFVPDMLRTRKPFQFKVCEQSYGY